MEVDNYINMIYYCILGFERSLNNPSHAKEHIMILFDIARGLLITILVALVGNLQPSAWLIIAGVAGSTLPDIDYAIYWMYGGRMGKWAHKHRDISHYPMITVPICFVATWALLDYWYAILITACVLGNYIFDSFDAGWGIRWFWPLSNRYFAYRPFIRGGSSNWQLHAWTPAQQDAAADQYGEEKWASDSSQWGKEALFLAISSGLTLGWYLFR